MQEETGYFGKITLQALIKFQREYSITPSVGYCGKKTRARLNALYPQIAPPFVAQER